MKRHSDAAAMRQMVRFGGNAYSSPVPVKAEKSVSCPDEVTMKQAAQRGIRGRCPCCGKGRLFARYLKQFDKCASCGEVFSGLRTDDVAPWATIIVIGHVFLPLAFMVDLTNVMPLWAELTLWSGVFAALSLTLLPVAKGMMLGVLWQTRATAEPTIVI